MRKEMKCGYIGLRNSFEEIRRQYKEREALPQLLIDMLEAGELEPCIEASRGRIRYWKAGKRDRFVNRHLLMETEVSVATVDLFLDGLIVFTVDADNPPQVRWRVTFIETIN